MANRYYRHSRLSESVFRRLVRSFAEDKTAAETAREVNLDRKSVTNIFLRIRRRLLEASVKNRPQLTLSGFKVEEPYFVAESEAECRRYAAQYQSRVLVVVFESGLVRADLIYAESERVFDKIKNLPDLKHQRVDDFGFYDVIGKLPRVSHWDTRLDRREYVENYSGNLLLYFLRRSKKFKGMAADKFILHLRETEWRFNKILDSEKVRQTPADIHTLNTLSKDMFDELLETLKTNPL